MRTIRELRRERGWTQYELAKRVGVHPQAVYLWESGRRTPLVPQMRRLGQAFELCSDEIALLGMDVMLGVDAQDESAEVPPPDLAPPPSTST